MDRSSFGISGSITTGANLYVGHTGSDTVKINVYDDRCQAAQSLPDYVPLVGDLNGDCKVDDLDVALLQENWLRDNSLTEEWFKVD